MKFPIVVLIFLTGLASSLATTASSAATTTYSSSSSPSSTTISNSKSCTGQPFGVARAASVCLRGGEVHQLSTKDEVDSIIKDADSKLVVIDFTATWCGPCKMIAPIYEQLSDSDIFKAKEVIFLKVDVDENPKTSEAYGVSAMPTFLFIKNGEVIDRLMGANPARLQALIDKHA